MIPFLTSPLGKVLIVILALGAWTVYQREQAANKAREECQSAQLQKTLDETLRQQQAAEDALGAARDQAEQTKFEMAALRKQLEQTNAEAVQLTDPCNVPESVRRRLSDIK